VGDVGTVTHDLPGWTAKLYRIMKITEEGDFTRHVVLKEETPSIHNDSMSSVIESYDYGSPSNPYAPVTDVTNLQISEATYYLDKDGKVGSDINASWTAPTDDTKRFIKYYQIELKKGAGDYEVVAVIGKSATSYTIVGVEAEVAYYVRVKIISSNDVVSDGSASAELTVNGKVALPTNVANFAYTFTNEIVLTWDKLADKDLWGYEIRTEDANWGVQSAALIFRGLANKFTIVTPASRAPGTYYIKAYDRSGNFSDAAQSVTPTNTIPSIPTIAATQWFGFAKIEWTDSADTDLQYYEIYKSHTNAWGGEEFLEVRVPGIAGILQGNDPVDATADAANSTSITDAEIAGKGADYFVGDIIVQTSGTHKDQETTVTAYNTTTGQVTVASWPSGTPDVGDTFALKDRAYYKVRAVDTYGPGTFSSAATINFTPLTESELGDEIISARKLTTGELITLTAQIKDAIITTAKILSLNADKINVGTLTGFTIQTATSGSRVVLTPNSLICYDDAANEVFKVLTSGADVGDVIIGDFAGNKGIKWDKSAATFSIRGALNADDIAAGTMSAARIGAGTFVGGSFVVGTGGDIRSANYVAGTTGFKLHPSTGLEINTGAMKGSVMEQFGITKTEAANGSISVIGDIVSVTLVATGKKIHAWSSGSVTGTFYVNSVAVITIKLYIDGTLVRSVSTTMNVIANGTYCVPFALSGTKDVSSGNRIIKVNYSKTGTMGASPTVDFDVIAMETRDQ
ncbi:MAG: hypothetical protein KAJ19_11275, partial [Gammaproteobacteria bacterium]|nr:hypothetical protein [Gammaproteobacteria bacterium]